MSILLPPDYYLANFHRLLNHAMETYGDLLNPEEQGFIAAYRCCGEDAQRLYVRLLTRKGPWFRADLIHYAEIHQPRAQAQALAAAGLLAINEAAPSVPLLELMRLEELQPWVRDLKPRPTRKTEVIGAIHNRWPAEWIRLLLRERFEWWRPRGTKVVHRLAALFFGNTHQHLDTFVVNDVGHVRYESVGWSAQQRPFQNRQSFDRFVGFAGLVHRMPDPIERLQWILQTPADRLNQRQRDRALLALSEQFGREQAPALGLLASRAVRGERARQRQQVLERRLAGKRGRRDHRHYEPEIEILPWAEASSGVEAAALHHYHQQGYRGAHWESAFSNALFGLVCWDIVFAPVPGAFFSPYQIGPVDLDDADFLRRRERPFEQRMYELSAGGSTWREDVYHTWHSKFGIANPFVAWEMIDFVFFSAVLERLDGAFVEALCRRIANDVREQRSGFPDLVLISPTNEVLFCEVKSLNDQLREHQRAWLEFLHRFHPVVLARTIGKTQTTSAVRVPWVPMQTR